MTVPPNRIRILRDMAITAGPKIAGGVLILAINLGLVFVWRPDIYGQWAFWLMLVLLADALIGAPVDMAVFRLAQAQLNETDRPGSRILQPLQFEHAAMVMKGLALLLVCLLLPVAGWFGMAAERDAVELFKMAFPSLTTLMALLILRSTLLHLQMRRHFMNYGLVETAHVTLRLVFAVLLVSILDLGPASLMWGFAFSAGLAAGLSMFLARESLLRRSKDLLRAARRLVAEFAWYFPTIALGAVIGRLDLLLMGFLAAAPVLGIYGAAANLASAAELIGAYLGIALMPLMVSRVQAGSGRAFIGGAHMAIFAFAAVVYGVSLIALEPILTAFAPAAYTQAAPLVLILLAGTLAGMLTTPLALPLVMLTRKSFLLKVDLCVLPLALAAYWFAIPSFGAFGAAGVAASVNLIRSLAVHILAWRLSAYAHDLQGH